MKKYIDRTNNFVEFFNSATGFYIRSGELLAHEGKIYDTGTDPFMRNFPNLIDIGIMGHCNHAACSQCYQSASIIKQPNMTLANFKKIADQCEGKVFSFALGGRGDANKHENFGDILQYSASKGIISNYTTSGIDLTDEEIALTKKYCGAVAISWYRQDFTYNAIMKFLGAGVKTNIHYVLNKDTIGEAIQRLKNNAFPAGINAVIFLLHKPVGQGQPDKILTVNNPQVQEFFDIINNEKFGDLKIGFDSCTVPAILNYTTNINNISIETCEAARYSMYIASDMYALPCSFDQEYKYSYNLSNSTIQEAWNSSQFDNFRVHFKNSCPDCTERTKCYGGCPIRSSIVLCNREMRNADA